jgi:hypothetical protein
MMTANLVFERMSRGQRFGYDKPGQTPIVLRICSRERDLVHGEPLPADFTGSRGLNAPSPC